MTLQLPIRIRSMQHFLLLLIGLELLFVLIFLVSTWSGTPIWLIHRFFDLDAERTFPAWFSSTQLLLIGIILFFSAGNFREAKNPSPWFLYLAASGFIFLSADEAISIHETITQVLKGRSIFPRFPGNHGIWISLYSAIGISLMLLSWRQLTSLWRDYRQASGIAFGGAAIFLAGAVGLEIISYFYLRSGNHPILYTLEVAAEEFMEMCGASLILYGVGLFATLRQDSLPDDGERVCAIKLSDRDFQPGS